MTVPLLEITNATKIYGGGFLQKSNKVMALQDFNLTLPGDTPKIVTIAGESGSGKSTLANLVLGFTSLTSGRIIFKGHDLSRLTRNERKVYRRHVQAVFQDPYAVYNPFYPVSHIYDMVIRNFKLAKTRKESRELIEDALNVVGMRGDEILHKYPHQLSGGQRQRMMVARAYLLKPDLIVADEPVSMVDASLRAMILDIMLRMRDQHGISFLYITHDLSTAYQVGDEIYLLYQGSIAERGGTTRVIENPKHPYVRQLIGSIPVPDPEQKWDSEISLPDDEQMRTQAKSGCRFYPRCPHCWEKCLTAQPPLYQMNEEAHQVACYLYAKKGD
jgi:peptide/nickel transport system ATP-binding protein